jgi:transposase
MEAVLECCCGLDVHRDSVVACILKGPNGQKPERTIRTFSSLPDGLKKLRSWLEEENCRHAAMESTGVYWQPVYNILEEAFDGTMVLLVVNARHMRNVPGRKTDMKDAEWIAQLLRSGLLDGSFIPSRPVRELRNLTRYRKTVVEDVNSQKNRIEKFLQSAGFKLSTFCSDVFGVSGRAIMEHLAEHGSISPSQVESLLKGRLRVKREEIALATRGSLTELQRDFLGMLLRHLCQLEANILEIDRKIDIVALEFQQQLEQLDSVPGIDRVAAQTVLAEIGTDMERFKTAAHICSWAGLSPGNNESAGKKGPFVPPRETPTSRGCSARSPGASPG